MWKSIDSYFLRYNFCTYSILSFWLSNGTYIRLFDNVPHFFFVHFWVFCCSSLLFMLQVRWPLLWCFCKFTSAASLCSFCCHTHLMSSSFQILYLVISRKFIWFFFRDHTSLTEILNFTLIDAILQFIHYPVFWSPCLAALGLFLLPVLSIRNTSLLAMYGKVTFLLHAGCREWDSILCYFPLKSVDFWPSWQLKYQQISCFVVRPTSRFRSVGFTAVLS